MKQKIFAFVTALFTALLTMSTVFLFVVLPRLKDWGATKDEKARVLPGDEIVPDAANQTTNAITIDAPPVAVWPWLVQMGCQRAGWYSYDLLDNGGTPSAEDLLPEFQDLAPGDILPSTVDGKYGFMVRRVEAPRVRVLGPAVKSATGERLSLPGGPSNSSWTFVLEPVREPDTGTDMNQEKTRLIVRMRAAVTSRTPFNRLMETLWDLAHLIMQRKQLRTLQQRVETMESTPAAAPVLGERPFAGQEA